jgi:hypothetical protein
VLALLKRWGSEATSFQMLQPGLSYHRGARGSCVAYVDTGRAWVTAGSPLAPEGELSGAAADFEAAASRRGRRVAYAGVEARFVEAVRCGWLTIGHQPLLKPTDPVDTYMAEARDKIDKEQKRIERQKKQDERDKQRAAQKAAPAQPSGAGAPPAGQAAPGQAPAKAGSKPADAPLPPSQ